ncbi:MAG: HAMP domain-containing sensor histidine kinase [Prevotella sp.]|jgi:signal transduction histidine kinase|nr:HAMP domain-containing sensor histidine kinase [Prevotella sp.]
MKRISVGTKLHLTVMLVFLSFTVAFTMFQHFREKQYKIDNLEIRLQSFNESMDDALHYIGRNDEQILSGYVKRTNIPDLRVTIITPKGKVVFDNMRKDYANFANHANRKEVRNALKYGYGSEIDRKSATLNREYFYSATYFKKDGFIIRSALPYDNNLSETLKTDQHYIWFSLTAIIILTLVLYKFTGPLGRNITKLRSFASKADHNESLDTEDLMEFPGDELGEIAEKIIKLYKRLQSTRKEQDVLKRQLTQNIAHELKTPVASIQGYLETILNNPGINEDMRLQFMQRCYAQSQRLTALLQDISTLNRMDDAPDMIDFTRVNISQTVKDIIKETSLQLSQKQMTFNDMLPDDIVIKGNQSLIYSIFRNLTDNAIAYAGVGTEITLSAVDNGKEWKFVFKDNGVGVPYKHLARLFERFYLVDKGRSRKMGGTGLGLAIVKNAVLLHKGMIKVENRKKGGLMFTFFLQK